MGRIIRMALAAATVALAGSPAVAQPAAAAVQVATVPAPPNAPGGAAFLGCYRANQTLAGRHRLTFCFDRRSTFRVTGSNMCDGSLTWRIAGRSIASDFQRTRCASGVWWERATMTCNPTGRLLPANASSGDFPRVSALRCTYRPSSGRMRATTFVANRT